MTAHTERLPDSLASHGFRQISKTEWAFDTKMWWEIRVVVDPTYRDGYNWWLAPLPFASHVPSEVVINAANTMAMISLEITR